MPKRLRLHVLEQTPKSVHILTSWRDPAGISRDPDVAKKLVFIRRCIENGTPLPSGYYRKGIGLNEDTLLETEGIMYLHLGKTNTSELLWLVQYSDHVVLLELSDHSHFATRPAGERLKNLHGTALARKQAELASLSHKRVMGGKIEPGRFSMKRRTGPIRPKPKV